MAIGKGRSKGAEAGGPSLLDILRDRIVEEIFGANGTSNLGKVQSWKILVLDAITLKIVSSVCSMTTLHEHQISLVEDLSKNRQPLPDQEAVYFISPNEDSITKLIEDFPPRKPGLYAAAHVYFSSSLPKSNLELIKQSQPLLPKLKALKEFNLETTALDSKSFVTNWDKSHPLRTIYRSGLGSQQALFLDAERLVTLLASLKRKPSIRFQGSYDVKGNALPEGIAKSVAEIVSKRMKGLEMAGALNNDQGCDVLVLDRSIDALSPAIHSWTYEALAYDLLPIDNGLYKYSVETSGGRRDDKTVILGETDELWVDLRHMHLAEASIKLNDKMEAFRKQNKAAKLKSTYSSGSGSETNTRDLRALVQALPQYREQLARLALHVELASSLNDTVQRRKLNDLGRIEESLALKEMQPNEAFAEFVGSEDELPSCWSIKDRIRILICLAAVNQSALTDSKQRGKWTTKLNLTDDQIQPVLNMMEKLNLGFPSPNMDSLQEKTSRRFGLLGRKEREDTKDEPQWELSRFEPALAQILGAYCNNKLPEETFPYAVGSAPPITSTRSFSARSVRSSTTWASSKQQDANRSGRSDRCKVVFIVGGYSHIEARFAHKNGVYIGGSELLTPEVYIDSLRF